MSKIQPTRRSRASAAAAAHRDNAGEGARDTYPEGPPPLRKGVEYIEPDPIELEGGTEWWKEKGSAHPPDEELPTPEKRRRRSAS